MKEMRTRIHRLTQDLNALLEELATLRKRDSGPPIKEIVTPDIIKDFKSSVDAVRRILWFYDATAINENTGTRNFSALNEIDAFQSTPPGKASRGSSYGSFIEKVEAIVERKIPSRSTD
jgi:hypothetical protein